MKKQKVLIICLVFVFLGLVAAALLLLRSSGTKQENGSGAEVLFQTDSSQVSEVHIENETGSYTVLQDDSQKISVDGYQDVPLNEEACRNLIHYASYIRSQERVQNREDNLGTYGLGAPSAVVRIRLRDGEEQQLSIGIPVPGQSSADCRYILYEDKVYTSYQLHLEPFLLGQTDYLQQQISPVARSADDANVTPATMLTATDISITRADLSHPMEIRRQEDVDVLGYSMQQYEILPDGEHAYLYTQEPIGTELLQSFYNLSADQVAAIHPDESALKQYGLSDPWCVAEVSWQNASGGSGSFSLRVSEPEEDSIFVMNDTADLIYEVRNVPVFLTVKPDQLISRYLLTPAITSVQELSLEDAETWAFTLEPQDDALHVECEGKSVEEQSFRSFYQEVISLQADEFSLGGENPQDYEKEGGIRFLLTDGSSREIALYRLNDRKLLIDVDDGRVFTVSRTKWDNLLAKCRSLIAA